MKKTTCSVYIATSADGFIADKDGGVEWLAHPDFTLEGEDFGYQAFMDSVDALLIGRNTFEQVLTFGDWPYTKPVYVATSRELSISENLTGKVFKVSGTPAEILAELQWHEIYSIYVDGGITIQQFLKDELLDRIIITRIPVLLGEGISLFGPVKKHIPLKTASSKSFPNGFVQVEYKPKY